MKSFDDTKPGSEQQESAYGVTAVGTPLATTAFKLRNILHGIHWEYQKKMLDLLQLAVGNDRQYELARDQALAHINQQERTMMGAVNAVLFERAPAPTAQEKAKERK